jgi:hypothetical protein
LVHLFLSLSLVGLVAVLAPADVAKVRGLDGPVLGGDLDPVAVPAAVVVASVVPVSVDAGPVLGGDGLVAVLVAAAAAVVPVVPVDVLAPVSMAILEVDLYLLIIAGRDFVLI